MDQRLDPGVAAAVAVAAVGVEVHAVALAEAVPRRRAAQDESRRSRAACRPRTPQEPVQVARGADRAAVGAADHRDR